MLQLSDCLYMYKHWIGPLGLTDAPAVFGLCTAFSHWNIQLIIQSTVS